VDITHGQEAAVDKDRQVHGGAGLYILGVQIPAMGPWGSAGDVAIGRSRPDDAYHRRDGEGKLGKVGVPILDLHHPGVGATDPVTQEAQGGNGHRYRLVSDVNAEDVDLEGVSRLGPCHEDGACCRVDVVKVDIGEQLLLFGDLPLKTVVGVKGNDVTRLDG